MSPDDLMALVAKALQPVVVDLDGTPLAVDRVHHDGGVVVERSILRQALAELGGAHTVKVDAIHFQHARMLWSAR